MHVNSPNLRVYKDTPYQNRLFPAQRVHSNLGPSIVLCTILILIWILYCMPVLPLIGVSNLLSDLSISVCLQTLMVICTQVSMLELTRTILRSLG